MIRLNVNIDHIATIREARKTFEPSVTAAAMHADLAGANGITIHLRGDRRHIQDGDAYTLRAIVKTHLNIEMAVTDEMMRIAKKVLPNAVTLVPESPTEITTEGGLDVVANEAEIKKTVASLRRAGILMSIFIDPEPEQVNACGRVGAQQIEICTARYADLTDPTRHHSLNEVNDELARIAAVAKQAGDLGLQVAAGHGLTYRNVQKIAEIHPVEELNIGHNIVARAALVGLERAVKEMIAAMGGQLI